MDLVGGRPCFAEHVHALNTLLSYPLPPLLPFPQQIISQYGSVLTMQWFSIVAFSILRVPSAILSTVSVATREFFVELQKSLNGVRVTCDVWRAACAYGLPTSLVSLLACPPDVSRR